MLTLQVPRLHMLNFQSPLPMGFRMGSSSEDSAVERAWEMRIEATPAATMVMEAMERVTGG